VVPSARLFALFSYTTSSCTATILTLLLDIDNVYCKYYNGGMNALFGVIIPDERFSLPEFVAQANQPVAAFSTGRRNGFPAARGSQRAPGAAHDDTGTLDEALREGREARYTGMHLLQLLVVRRLMAEGYTTGAIKKLIAGASIERLEALLEGEAQPQCGSNGSPLRRERAAEAKRTARAGHRDRTAHRKCGVGLSAELAAAPAERE
jgi:hypothetical protein